MRFPIRALACALVACATASTPTMAKPAYDPAVQGSLAIGHCLDAAHKTAEMGPGQYVEAPQYLDPVKASDAELACYGLPARPEDPAELKKWIIGMHALPIPKEWVANVPAPIMANGQVVRTAYPPSSSALGRQMQLNRPALQARPAGRASRPSQSYGGTENVWLWGGWQANVNVGQAQLYVAQGQWRTYLPYTLDQGTWAGTYAGHILSQWVGLGCCADSPSDNQLLQVGTYTDYWTQGSTYYTQTYGFWEIPCNSPTPNACKAYCPSGVCGPPHPFGPAFATNQVAAAVVETFSGGPSGQTSFEVCNEDTNQCSWASGEQGYAAEMATYETEDTGCDPSGYCHVSNQDAPPYRSMEWGPLYNSHGTYINNQNGADNVLGYWEPITSSVFSLDNNLMNANRALPAWIDPQYPDGSTYYNDCGEEYSTHSYNYYGYVSGSCLDFIGQ